MSAATIDAIAATAGDLDDDKLNELAAYALWVKSGDPAPRVEFDTDPVLPLLKDCLALSLADKRRLNRLLALLIARESSPLAGGTS